MQRMLLLKLLTICGLTLAVTSGCSEQQKHVNKLSKKPWVEKTAMWPELQKLTETTDLNNPQEGSISRLMRATNRADEDGGGGGAPKPYCKIVTEATFKAKLAAFEAAEIPPDFRTDARVADKAAFIAEVKSLQEMCGKKPAAKELEAKVQNIIKLYDDIRKIPGQKRPEGAEAEKYAPQ